MTPKKTPMELLKARKKLLEIKAEQTTQSLLNTLEYGQNHVGSMLTATLVESVTPILPPFAQRLISGGSKPTKKNRANASTKSDTLGLISDGVLELMPLILKGSKGLIASFLLKKLKKMVFR